MSVEWREYAISERSASVRPTLLICPEPWWRSEIAETEVPFTKLGKAEQGSHYFEKQ